MVSQKNATQLTLKFREFIKGINLIKLDGNNNKLLIGTMNPSEIYRAKKPKVS